MKQLFLLITILFIIGCSNESNPITGANDLVTFTVTTRSKNISRKEAVVKSSYVLSHGMMPLTTSEVKGTEITAVYITGNASWAKARGGVQLSATTWRCEECWNAAVDTVYLGK